MLSFFIIGIESLVGIMLSPVMDHGNFSGAIAFLRSRSRTRSTAVVPNALPKAVLPAGDLAGKGIPASLGMKEWLQGLGHSDRTIRDLKIIHVGGTKGKGSTCAFIESLLRAHGERTRYPRKTGLYTSPHLISETERIRINSQPVPDATFAKYVYQVRDLLKLDNPYKGPGYLQLLALISFHTFIQEKVDVAIYETHHGGEFCATNVIDSPIATAITTIDVDHVIDLGPGIENIAWHKGGIFKPTAAAFTVPQQPIVMKVLEERAKEKGVSLIKVQENCDLPSEFTAGVQRLNCSLARAVTDVFLRETDPEGQPRSLSQEDISRGVRQFHWPGRFEIIQRGKLTWFLDCAHNALSVATAAHWFQRASSNLGSSSVTRVVIFGQQRSTKRDYKNVLRTLAKSLSGLGTTLQGCIFTSARGSIQSDEGELLQQYKQIWQCIRPGDNIDIAETVGDAIQLGKSKCTEEDTHIFITGSTYLIGEIYKHGL